MIVRWYLDLFHSFVIYITQASRIGENRTAEDITHKTDESVEIINIQPEFAPSVSGSPVHHVALTTTSWYLRALLFVIHHFPVCDYSSRWTSDDEAVATIEEVFDVSYADPRYAPFTELSKRMRDAASIEKCRILVRESIGAHLLCRGVDDTYFIDLLHMSKYAVRSPFRVYGARGDFDMNMNVISITLPYNPVSGVAERTRILPESDEFSIATRALASSIGIHTTIVEHLQYTHLTTAGNMNCIRLFAPTRLRSILDVFLFDTTETNAIADKILLRPGGILSRLSAFTSQSLQLYLANWRDVSINTESSQDTPFGRDVRAFRSATYKFVDSLFAIIGKEELDDLELNEAVVKYANGRGLRQLLVELIVTVSIYHEQVGGVASLFLHQTGVYGKVYNGDFKYDTKQTTMHTANLAILTASSRMPRITEELEHTLDDVFTPCFKEWRRELRDIQFECPHLHLEEMECSVSL